MLRHLQLELLLLPQYLINLLLLHLEHVDQGGFYLFILLVPPCGPLETDPITALIPMARRCW
mgnify:CR=1 FL=1